MHTQGQVRSLRLRDFILSIALIWATSVVAVGAAWTPMTGDEIRAALTGHVLSYGESWQDFHASGRTLFNARTDSWGYWQVQNDQYCRQ